jgi:hypothetical protein
MNLRHPKVIRLGGWGAGVTTLLAVAAGGYLAMNFLQAGDLLNGGIAAGMTVAVALFGGLLAYGLFVFAAMQPAPPEAAISSTSEAAEPASLDESPGDEDAAIAISVANSPLPPPELSDDAIPVFADSQSSSTGEDDSVADLLVVPPPIDALDDSDSISVERSVSAEDFDSRMDLPVTIEAPELNVEDLDDVPPVVQSRTNPVVSAMTQTDEIDAVDDSGELTPAESELQQPEEAADLAKPSLTDAFPDIFKSTPPKAVPVVSEKPVAPAPAPVPQRPAVAPPPAAKAAPAATAKPAAEMKPAPRPAPPPVETVDEESLPVVDDLSDIAITLGPVTPAGVLPTEIPDFFLKMPTGRSMPAAAKPSIPAAPVAPRQVAPQKPVHHAQAVVRIIDSTTSSDAGDDLVTMTSIPDDWPS